MTNLYSDSIFINNEFLTNQEFCFENSTFKTNEISIYVVDIEQEIQKLEHYINLISSDEKIKADKYRHQKDKERYIIAKANLRILIAQYLKMPPESILYGLTENLKPYVIGSSNLHFNVSHSGNKVAIVVYNDSVGVDIERIDFDFKFTEILENSFNEFDKHSILNSEETTKQFFLQWTRKEALVKATSVGINDSFKSLPSMEGSYVVSNKELMTTHNWKVDTMSIENDYYLSIAYVSNNETKPIYLYHWPNN